MRRPLALIAVVAAVVLAGCGSGPPQLPVNATGAAKESSTAGADMAMRIANVRYELADGVKADRDHQNAYKMAAATLDDAKQIAKAFGVTGAVHSDDYGWTIGASGDDSTSSGDVTTKSSASNESVFVGRNGSFSVNGSSAVSSGVVCADQSRPPSMAGGVFICEPTTTINPNLPSTDEAKKIASDVLKAAGVDISGMKASVTPSPDVVNVTFRPAFDGTIVEGVEVAVTVGPDNTITYASGFVGAAKSVGSYELAPLQRAVDRLNASSVYPAIGGGVRALDAREMAPVQPDPGGTDQTEPAVVKLTGVKVGLMMTSDDSDQSLWLTPAYIFDTADQGSVTTPAAADKYLPPPSTTPAPKPGGTDVPPPAEGGGGGSTEPSPGTGSCSAVTADAPAGSDNQPISGQLCVSSTQIKAGDAVDFTLSFSDPDRAFVDGPCGDAVTPDYGDKNAPGEAQCLACPTGVADGPGKANRERTHTYAQAGTYVTTFTIKSGNTCGPADPHDSTAKVSVKITVA